MSHQHNHEDDQDAHLDEEDIVEVHEDDDGDVPMDDEDEGYESDGDNAKYDGEIVIGAPANAEEEEEYARMEQDAQRAAEDNSWGASSLHAAQQSVFTVALHPTFPNPPLAVSGGEDDAAFIYSPLPSSSGAAVHAEAFPPVKLTGHTDSVVSVGWSSDGEMVATGGMDGRVRVWRRVKSRRGTPTPSGGDGAGAAGEWKDWEFLTSLETGSEVQVSTTWRDMAPVWSDDPVAHLAPKGTGPGGRL
jgi:ribosome assembly protein SQT1